MLQQLASDLRREGGFEVFHWAGNRQDITDYKPEGLVDVDTYVRAVHNLRNPARLEHSKFHPYIELVFGYGVRDTDKPPTDSFGYGVLRKWIEREFEVKVRKKGLLGLFGLECMQKRSEYVLSEMPLGDVLKETTYPAREAHFMALRIGAIVADSVGRCGGRPRLTVVSHKDLIQETVEYLRSNPDDYLALIKSLLPREEFPKVNQGILDVAHSGQILIALNTELAKLKPDGMWGHAECEYKGRKLTQDGGYGYLTKDIVSECGEVFTSTLPQGD